ncbi:MAG TPA: hypothetical protein VIZ28_15025 [Chitinophagaceae bacterium]
MSSHFDLTDEQFEQQFESCTLSPAVFNHEAHLRLAWIHIRKYGREIAIKNICSQLIVFTKSVNTEDKYNMTLTVAAVNAVNHFMTKTNADDFSAFIAEFPRLKSNFKELMSSHYKLDIFSSEIAKREFIEPDLLPF